VTITALQTAGALYAGTGRLNSNRVSIARMAFNQRTDACSEPILATLKYIVHHPGLVDVVRTIRASELVPELATNAANVVAGDFIPIEDPYITGTAPNLPWYAFTDYQADNVIPLVIVRRAGMPAPMLVRKSSDMQSFANFSAGGASVSPIMGDFATGNVVVKVMDEWGTYLGDETDGNLFDIRGAYYSAGTAA